MISSVQFRLFITVAIMAFVFSCVRDYGNTLRNNEKKETLSGKLVGVVTRGPILPISKDENLQTKPAINVKIMIITLSRKTVETVATDNDGRYSITLPGGTYRVEMLPSSSEMTKDLPTVVTIIKGKETHLDIHIDTRIR